MLIVVIVLWEILKALIATIGSVFNRILWVRKALDALWFVFLCGFGAFALAFGSAITIDTWRNREVLEAVVDSVVLLLQIVGLAVVIYHISRDLLRTFLRRD